MSYTYAEALPLSAPLGTFFNGRSSTPAGGFADALPSSTGSDFLVSGFPFGAEVVTRSQPAPRTLASPGPDLPFCALSRRAPDDDAAYRSTQPQDVRRRVSPSYVVPLTTRALHRVEHARPLALARVPDQIVPTPERVGSPPALIHPSGPAGGLQLSRLSVQFCLLSRLSVWITVWVTPILRTL